MAITQDEFAKQVGASRTVIALLEQGRRMPGQKLVEKIVEALKLPDAAVAPFFDPEEQIRLRFEQYLGELVGRSLRLEHLDPESVVVARKTIHDLFHRDKTLDQAYDAFCTLLVFYDVTRPTKEFFEHYLGVDAVSSLSRFETCVEAFQRDAIRLFATFAEAYSTLSGSTNLKAELDSLQPKSDEIYRHREPWDVIERIPSGRLADLGYISAARIQQEHEERQALSTFLVELADALGADPSHRVLTSHSERKRRKMGSLLRKFNSRLLHDFLSPLFALDPDELRREAERVAPKEEAEVARIADTQAMGQRNLARYLAADHLDVYVATSMRSEADFASVHSFVEALFAHDEVRPLKLRYFDPTQSWIEDRVAKGLVEALMLRRSRFSVYMAQKEDTFGKDSEASVALGQGKPVIVYVPCLVVPEVDLDASVIGSLPHEDLVRHLRSEIRADELDETADQQALTAQLIAARLERASADALAKAAYYHWADFDLIGEAKREENEGLRSDYRGWIDQVIKSRGEMSMPEDLRTTVVSIFTALATNFERRAHVFREIHPLALQVILSSGVLNGILVARSIDSCGRLLAAIIKNTLALRLESDENNFRLIETSTRSTVRVISRNQLIVNAFASHYERRKSAVAQ